MRAEPFSLIGAEIENSSRLINSWWDHRALLYVLLLSKRILIMGKKEIWVFQYREAYEEDYVELFDKKPSREYLDKLLYELLPFTFDHDDLTPAKQRLDKEDPVYYETLYKCEVNQIEEGAADGN